MQMDHAPINDWRLAQRARLQAISPLPALDAAAKPPRTALSRTAYFALGVFLLVAPVGAFFQLAPALGALPRTGLFLAAFAYLGITAAFWRVAAGCFGEAFRLAKPIDALWDQAARLVKSDVELALRFAAEGLTYPWENRFAARLGLASAIWSRREPVTKPTEKLHRAFVDLFAVEILVEAWFKPNSALAGNLGQDLARRLSETVYDSDALADFAKIIRNMAEGQRTAEGNLPSLVFNLAGLIERRAPRAASILDGKERALDADQSDPPTLHTHFVCPVSSCGKWVPWETRHCAACNRTWPLASIPAVRGIVHPKTHVSCPDCKRYVPRESSACKYCGRELVPLAPPSRVFERVGIGIAVLIVAGLGVLLVWGLTTTISESLNPTPRAKMAVTVPYWGYAEEDGQPVIGLTIRFANVGEVPAVFDRVQVNASSRGDYQAEFHEELTIQSLAPGEWNEVQVKFYGFYNEKRAVVGFYNGGWDRPNFVRDYGIWTISVPDRSRLDEDLIEISER